jgi:hypothetical protein
VARRKKRKFEHDSLNLPDGTLVDGDDMIGRVIAVPARKFNKGWAKACFGDNWASAVLHGRIATFGRHKKKEPFVYELMGTGQPYLAEVKEVEQWVIDAISAAIATDTPHKDQCDCSECDGE